MTRQAEHTRQARLRRRRRKERRHASTPRSAWRSFEAECAHALEVIGYSVERDALRHGSQIDIVATHRGPLSTTTLLVECKSSDTNIGVSEVRDFAGLIARASDDEKTTLGMIVAKRGFSKEARAFASQTFLLTTISELWTRSFDPTLVTTAMVAAFDRDSLSRDYVELACRVSGIEAGTVYRPVESFFDDFFHKTDRTGVAVLGNFGTGKTCLCRHYAYLLAKQWSGPDDSLLPLLVRLRDFRSFLSIEDELCDALHRDVGIDIDKRAMAAWLRRGRTLLMLDGFDEMAVRMDRQTVSANIEHLDRFCARYPRMRVILSCRTHFFRSEVDETALRGMLRLYVLDWGSNELETYVKKRLGDDADLALASIRDTYNLEELARTPVFLSMMSDSIDSLRGTASHAKLYEVYTSRWIRSQDSRARLSPEEKATVMEALAVVMTRTGSSDLHFDRLSEAIKGVFPGVTYESLRGFDEDIRTCSFLVRDGGGNYRFSHRSFMEFFVAVSVSKRFQRGDGVALDEMDLSQEVAGFIAAYLEGDIDVLRKVIQDGQTERIRVNAIRIATQLRSRALLEDAVRGRLKRERSVLVREAALDYLVAAGSDTAIEAVVRCGRGAIGEACAAVRALAKAERGQMVVNLFHEILVERRDVELVATALTALSKLELALEPDVAALLRSGYWKGRPQVIDGLLLALEQSHAVPTALAARVMLDEGKLQSTGDRLRAAERLVTSLQRRFASAIEEAALSAARSGLKYEQAEGRVRADFGYLATTPSLRRILDRAFPEEAQARRGRGRRKRR